MRFFVRRPFPILLLLAALGLSLGACGKRGPVRPLAELSPAAPPNFSAEQKGESILLSWDLPRVNQDDSPLVDLAGFRIYRLTFHPEDPCPECREEQAPLVAELDLDYLPSGSRLDERLFWFDTCAALGSGYLYRILPVNHKGRPGAAARSHLILGEPPAPPVGLSAAGHDRLVRLSWAPVTSLPEEAELLGYHLYRRSGDAPYSPQPLTREPLSAAQFEDFSVANDQVYSYALRTVMVVEDRRIFSSRSEEISVVPKAGR
ncbi:hypothetical protein SAMN05660860_00093 [Geoalkalibacter ferrihydriticus]|uniref:Fibronectin type-III domain-containing protein n=2 Tax=Geoalkalibacter ferrihydriticus TaxID=392333 RepID=A0A0C2ECG3_9BACT|nr:hypothetical protein [Geoalkalibacter ferrihydriticus]KIH76283.1 hypothetical protein GFER_11765 [Geoalkalibacter ferrihydriticus DSM 17813]SDL22901.1 hypothetical protein SAMN05660860_00093 [Geoalkalibacter ferrihydriticus]